MADDDYFSDDSLGDLGEDVFQALDQAAYQASQRPQAQASQLPAAESLKPPWSEATSVSKEDQEARASYLQRQRQRQQSQHYVKLQQQQQLRHSQVSRQQQQPQSQFTHQQRQLQPRQAYQPTQSNYVTLPTLPSSPIHFRGNLQQYAAPEDTTTLGRQQEEIADTEGYGDFAVTVELLETAGPTALVPQQMMPGDHMVEDSYRGNGQYQKYNEGYDAYAEEVVMEDANAVEGYEAQNNMTAEVHEELSQMKQMVQQLMAEKGNLEKSNEELQSKVYAKTGESAILRSKIEKEAREHERIVTSLNALQSEKEEQHKRVVASLETEFERMKTNNVFLQRDLKEVVTKNKSLEKGRKTTVTLPKSDKSAINDITTTPRKNRSYALRDGFEDGDLGWGSPTKSGGKLKGSPSKGGSKRKRRQEDSPVSSFSLQLPLSQARVSPPHRQESDIEESIVQAIDDQLIEKLTHNDDRFEYFRALTVFRTSSSRNPVLEFLSQYRFPSSQESTISSIILNKITTVQNAPGDSHFPAGVCKILLSVWERCLTEKFFDPLTLILDLLYYAMTWSLSGSIYALILDDLIDLIQRTIEPAPKDDPSAVIVLESNYAPCFKLFNRLAQGALASERLSKRLWKSVRPLCPVVFLQTTQPSHNIRCMIRILCTSTRYESFGPITDNDAEQRTSENRLIDCMGRLLLEDPQFEDGISEAIKRVMLLELRMDVCSFLACIVTTRSAMDNLSKNTLFAARLVRRIAEEIDEAYIHRYGIEQSVGLINAGMRILRGILGSQDLMSVPFETGPAYLVAMTRLAFLEEGSHLKELGIAEDVIDAAREILENTLTMEEAEKLGAMFNHV